VVALGCCHAFYVNFEADKPPLIVTTINQSGGWIVSALGCALMGVSAVGVWYSASIAPSHQSTPHAVAASPMPHVADGAPTAKAGRLPRLKAASPTVKAGGLPRLKAASPTSHAADAAILSHLPTDEETGLA